MEENSPEANQAARDLHETSGPASVQQSLDPADGGGRGADKEQQEGKYVTDDDDDEAEAVPRQIATRAPITHVPLR